MIATTTHLGTVSTQTHLGADATTTHLGTVAVTTHLETYAAVTHLGTIASTLSSPQIVLQRLNTHIIKIITSEMDANAFYSKGQKQHLPIIKFRITTSLKEQVVHLMHTSLLMANETEPTRPISPRILVEQ